MGRDGPPSGMKRSKVGKREAILHRIPQLIHEKAMFVPIFELALKGKRPNRSPSSRHL